MGEPETSDIPSLPAINWALLGMLSYERELSGYDIRKWIHWSMRFFFGSPAYSQIYAELKKLEKLGLLSSRVEGKGARYRRLYKITDKGLDAVSRWAKEAPIELPTLKHPAILRVMLGHSFEKSVLILSHLPSGSSWVSGLIASTGHSGSQTPQSMHSSG